MRITLQKLVLLALVGFVVIQLVPVWLWQTNPAGRTEPAWDRPQTRALAQRACFDCHSNQTTWPLYSRIAPSSWLVTWDVVNGRRHLNFDEWDRAFRRDDPQRLSSRFRKEISEGDMPPNNYLLLHPDARLTLEEQQQLIDGLQQTVGDTGTR